MARKTVGYKKVKLYTAENVGYGDVHLPDVEMHTMSFWLTLPGAPLRAAGYRGLDVVDGLLGLGSALRSLACLHLMCDGHDLGLALADPEDAWVAGLDRGGQRTVRREDDRSGDGEPLDSLQLEQPTLFLYDNLPGGVGFAEKAYALSDVLLEQARGLIVACGCASGCPSCVGAIGEVEAGARSVAIDLADWLTGRIPRPRGPEWVFVPARPSEPRESPGSYEREPREPRELDPTEDHGDLDGIDDLRPPEGRPAPSEDLSPAGESSA